MLIASMIIKTLPEDAKSVLKRLEKIPNVIPHGIHNDDNIIIVMEAEDQKTLEAKAKGLAFEIEEILGVYPTFVGDEEDVTDEMIN